MDINDVDQSEDCFEEVLTENSSDSSDSFGEQLIISRVGDKYQAVIPSLLTPSERLKYFSCPYDSQHMLDGSDNLLIGLPVLVTWVNKEVIVSKDGAAEGHDEVDSFMTDPKHCGKQNSIASDKKEVNAKVHCLDQRRVIIGSSIAPGLPTEPWSESEVGTFLLGLYIFGKNFHQVKKFMETKEMGQIISFYYGKFFKSAKYRQWADCRKIKGRKCIIGQRLLIGSRQQELYSRLLPGLSDESKNTLLEAYKAFTDGKTSVEDYISALKNIVGVHMLVEAVAIGKARKDLTVMEPSRTTQMSTSKPCSELTLKEILKYLSGEIRISKARSSDLFWEAVWPRLLEKGWHSEESKSNTFRDSMKCLVFIIPGIKKFKRKLLKGEHYYDSFYDVLKKVASEPELLVLQNEEIENGLGTVQNSDEDSGSNHNKSRYLKPRFSSETANSMRFTVVDTSLFHDDQPSKVRELRSIPAEKNDSSAGLHTSSKAEVHDEVEDPDKASDLSDKLKDFVIRNRSKKRVAHNKIDPLQKPVENHLDHSNVYLSADNKPLSVEHKAVAQSDCANPVVKRRKLSACSKSETACTVGDMSKPSVVSQNKLLQRLPSLGKETVRSDSHARTHEGVAVSPTSSLAVSSHGEKNNMDSNQGSCCSATSSESYEKSHPLIDLNKPPPAIAESKVNGEAIKVETEVSNDWSHNVSNDTRTPMESSEPVGGSTVDGICSQEQVNTHARRQGSRARPMSTRALEALESSFIKSEKAMKRSSADSREPRPSRRSRAKMSTLGNCSAVESVDPVRDTKAVTPNEVHSAVNDVISDPLAYLEKDCERDS